MFVSSNNSVKKVKVSNLDAITEGIQNTNTLLGPLYHIIDNYSFTGLARPEENFLIQNIRQDFDEKEVKSDGYEFDYDENALRVQTSKDRAIEFKTRKLYKGSKTKRIFWDFKFVKDATYPDQGTWHLGIVETGPDPLQEQGVVYTDKLYIDGAPVTSRPPGIKILPLDRPYIVPSQFAPLLSSFDESTYNTMVVEFSNVHIRVGFIPGISTLTDDITWLYQNNVQNLGEDDWFSSKFGFNIVFFTGNFDPDDTYEDATHTMFLRSIIVTEVNNPVVPKTQLTGLKTYEFQSDNVAGKILLDSVEEIRINENNALNVGIDEENQKGNLLIWKNDIKHYTIDSLDSFFKNFHVNTWDKTGFSHGIDPGATDRAFKVKGSPTIVLGEDLTCIVFNKTYDSTLTRRLQFKYRFRGVSTSGVKIGIGWFDFDDGITFITFNLVLGTPNTQSITVSKVGGIPLTLNTTTEIQPENWNLHPANITGLGTDYIPTYYSYGNEYLQFIVDVGQEFVQFGFKDYSTNEGIEWLHRFNNTTSLFLTGFTYFPVVMGQMIEETLSTSSIEWKSLTIDHDGFSPVCIPFIRHLKNGTETNANSDYGGDIGNPTFFYFAPHEQPDMQHRQCFVKTLNCLIEDDRNSFASNTYGGKDTLSIGSYGIRIFKRFKLQNGATSEYFNTIYFLDGTTLPDGTSIDSNSDWIMYSDSVQYIQLNSAAGEDILKCTISFPKPMNIGFCEEFGVQLVGDYTGISKHTFTVSGYCHDFWGSFPVIPYFERDIS